MPEVIDKTEEQKGAEADVDSFRKALGPFVVAAESTRMAMVFTDAKAADNPIIFANNAFLSLTGFDRDEVLANGFTSLMARGTDPETLAKVDAAFKADREQDLEVGYRRSDGSVFWTEILISPVKDQAGDIVQHFCSFIDLTQHKQEQAHSKMLIDELNHRVKNTLTTVQSITRQALRTAIDPETIGESIESRIFALSRSHDLLTRASWEGAGLHDLIDAALEPFGTSNGRTERFTVSGENIRLMPRATLALGIAFHELATNAVKYGAFSNETGTITIAWTVEPSPDGDRLILVWREKNGPSVTPPSRKGFGSQVIERGLGHELDGNVDLDYRPDGVVCTIDIAAPRGPLNG